MTTPPPFPVPPFPGAVGVSHLRVYDSEAPDGLRGGTPHLHTVCTEAYVVIAGTGEVHTLSPGGFEVTPLVAGALVWFTPGTIHRLVNLDGRLEIVVLMQNAGLPEAGDMVITFPDDVLAEPDRYRAEAALAEGERTTAGPDDGARRRRDLGVQGFTALRAAFDEQGPAALEALHRRVAVLVADHADRWRDVWAAGPKAAVDQTGRQLEALAAGDARHLLDASVHRLAPPGDERRFGCCGTLGTYLPN